MLGANVQALAEVAALGAERLAARTGAEVFALDIVARVAVGIVVMDTGFHRVPRGALRHDDGPFNLNVDRLVDFC